MKTLTENGLTAAALERLANAPDARMREIMTALIRHLHDFVRETALTPAEWKSGIDFLTAVGHLTDERRQEFVLLSDTLGVSAMVDLVRHRYLGRGTASSLLGPFYRPGAPELPYGANIAGATPGEPIKICGWVTDGNGRAIAGAALDIWQAAPNGKYDIQEDDSTKMNLRGTFRTDTGGRYEFRSVKPNSYPVPNDGPVGVLLRAQGRHPYRPAHIHFIITADGYEPLITAVYIAGDSYIESDAVFGAKPSLTIAYRKNDAADEDATEPAQMIEFDFALVPAVPTLQVRSQRATKPARATKRSRNSHRARKTAQKD